MKKSFVMYQDYEEVINKLPDEKAGMLIKAIMEYNRTGIMPELDELLSFVVIPIKQNLDRDRKKYEEEIEKRRKAGKASAEKRQQEATQSTHVNTCQHMSTDNDNDNVNVIVNENVNDDEEIDSPAVDKQPTEPPEDEVFLTFQTNGIVKQWHLYENQILEWERLYDGLDVRTECKKALAWITANNKKTAKGMNKFLVGWLNRANDRGGNKNSRDGPKEDRFWDAGAHLRELNEKGKLW